MGQTEELIEQELNEIENYVNNQVNGMRPIYRAGLGLKGKYRGIR
jgi:hypothetical protein